MLIIKISNEELEVNRVINISPNGNDGTGDGSVNNPYKTLGKAINTSVSGDAIFFMKGNHYLTNSEVYGTGIISSNGLFSDNGKDLIIYSDMISTRIFCTYTTSNPMSYEGRYYVFTIRGVSKIINLNLELNYPSNNDSYQNSIFVWCNGKAIISNNIIRIINTAGTPSLFYDNSGQKTTISNNVIYFNSKGYSRNYSGNPVFIDNYSNINYWGIQGIWAADTSSSDVLFYKSYIKGIFHGLYPVNVFLFLLKRNNQYYSILPEFYDSDLEQYIPLDGLNFNKGFLFDDLFTETTINKKNFKPIEKFDNFRIVTDLKQDYNIMSLYSNKELIVANDDIVTSMAEKIDYFNIIANETGNGLIKLAFSIDKGITWKTYNGAEFIDLSCNIPLKNYIDLTEEELILWNAAKEEIYSNGVTTELFNSIDFNLLNAKTVRFAYVLSRLTCSDTSETSQLDWQFDAKGSMRKMTDSEHTVDVYEHSIKVTTLIDNQLIKTNIII